MLVIECLLVSCTIVVRIPIGGIRFIMPAVQQYVMEQPQSMTDTDDDHVGERSLQRIEQSTRSNNLKQRQVQMFDDMFEHQQFLPDGRIDWDHISSNTEFNRRELYNVLANHGQYAYYTDTITDSEIEVLAVTDGTDVQTRVRRAIKQYATYDPYDKVVDYNDVVDKGGESRSTVINNVAKCVRVKRPWSQRPSENVTRVTHDYERDGFMHEDLQQDVDVDYVRGMNQFEAFELGYQYGLMNGSVQLNDIDISGDE